MLHINLSDEEAGEIVATTAMELDNIPMEIFAVTFAGKLIAELSKASEKKEKVTGDEKKPNLETIQAGLWKIIISEREDNKSQLTMLWRDHVRIDRILENKHLALEYAFNALVS